MANQATNTLTPEQMKKFGQSLDNIRKEIELKIGSEDLDYIKKMQRLSNGLELTGRSLIHFSIDPLTFSAGVIALWLHKQLEATEIGHTALHGAFDKIEGAEKWHSKSYKWKIPIDEASWHRGHNLAHHQYTNVAGKDGDIHFGPVRLTDKTPHSRPNNLQLYYALFFLFPNFALLMNMHFTGLVDYYFGNGRSDKYDYIKDRSFKTGLDTHKRALRKFVPYYAKEYLLFPALAGPGFGKVLLGNWMAETMRDIYSAATIFCGHIGEDVASYEEGTRAHGRGQWYAMQVASANNFEVPLPVSQLCGALDLQIEHHLFPKFPTNRLREAAPRVKAVCEKYGIEYKTDTWPATLKKAFRHISALSRPDDRNVAQEIGHLLSEVA